MIRITCLAVSSAVIGGGPASLQLSTSFLYFTYFEIQTHKRSNLLKPFFLSLISKLMT
ncbi:hypothetical protein RchiOBHm_Chr1g0336231 [Rosa chinensis]|uniref:Uncharacterized protein n=1 Tax=Rosa chinensis TaxID=74649 RepID=A0A2P6SCM8_ROSCH|nr:hypothetical protein RchiOBHm_Chr1g0336231 [Rosa chinensis]